MSKLPQVNVRLAPEHHALIRELAQRLRANPSFAVGLADFLAQAGESEPTQVSPLAYGLADTDADLKERLEENRDLTLALQERLMIQSEGLQRTTAYADSINERVKALEQPAALRSTDGNTDVLQSILDRLAALEEREPRMVRIEAVEARMAALEETMAGVKAAPPRPVQVEPRQPRPPRPLIAGKRRPPTPITDDIRRQVHDLRSSGLSRDAVAHELQIGGSTVSRILDAPRPPDIPST